MSPGPSASKSGVDMYPTLACWCGQQSHLKQTVQNKTSPLCQTHTQDHELICVASVHDHNSKDIITQDKTTTDTEDNWLILTPEHLANDRNKIQQHQQLLFSVNCAITTGRDSHKLCYGCLVNLKRSLIGKNTPQLDQWRSATKFPPNTFGLAKNAITQIKLSKRTSSVDGYIFQFPWKKIIPSRSFPFTIGLLL